MMVDVMEIPAGVTVERAILHQDSRTTMWEGSDGVTYRCDRDFATVAMMLVNHKLVADLHSACMLMSFAEERGPGVLAERE